MRKVLPKALQIEISKNNFEKCKRGVDVPFPLEKICKERGPILKKRNLLQLDPVYGQTTNSNFGSKFKNQQRNYFYADRNKTTQPKIKTKNKSAPDFAAPPKTIYHCAIGKEGSRVETETELSSDDT